MTRERFVPTKIYIDRRTKAALKELAVLRDETMSHVAEVIMCDYVLTFVHPAELDSSGASRLDMTSEAMAALDKMEDHCGPRATGGYQHPKRTPEPATPESAKPRSPKPGKPTRELVI